MPYCLPSPPSSPNVSSLLHDIHPDTPPVVSRNHRRSSSAISFLEDSQVRQSTPLPILPRRKLTSDPSPLVSPRRAVFSLNHDDDDDDENTSSEDSLEEEQEVTKLARSLALGLNIDGTISKSTASDSSIPFPVLPSTNTPSPPSSPLPRTVSNPVILPNGKPLKPSLKSASSPNLPDELKPLHLRSQSAPSTPATPFPKNVHFKDERDGGLETIRIYNKAGKPANLNYGSAAEETETETEYESSTAFGSYPFPHQESIYALSEHPRTSQVPNPDASEYDNVHLESLSLPRSRPPLLRGSVLVRNITFAKNVAIRFTMDEWQTTSEVNGTYVTSLPTLPPPFSTSTEESDSPSNAHVSWDWASIVSHATWDRFSFVIKLEDVERKLTSATMFVALRYQAHGPGGGEWWDNNSGANYKLAFQELETNIKPKSKLGTNLIPTAMFSAASTSPSFPPSNRTSSPSSRPAFPFAVRPSPPSRTHSNPTIPTYATLGSIGAKPKSRLSLSNYVAPSFHHEDEEITSPNATSLHTFEPAELGSDMLSPSSIIGGMPATAPMVQLQWPTSSPVSPTATSMPNVNVTAQLEAKAAASNLSSLPTPAESPSISPSQSALFETSSPSNNTYAEFVKKWCFHQSPPPVASTPPRDSSAVNTLNPWLGSYDSPSFRQSPILTGFERA